MTDRKRQAGATLLVTLVALVVVTLLALAAIRGSSINLRITGNMQAVGETESAAQAAVDAMVADIDTFKTPPSTTTDVDVAIGGKTYDVALDMPRCINSKTAPGYSLLYSSPPVDQVWNIGATASDSIMGAAVTVHQGVRVRMPVGTACPN